MLLLRMIDNLLLHDELPIPVKLWSLLWPRKVLLILNLHIGLQLLWSWQ